MFFNLKIPVSLHYDWCSGRLSWNHMQNEVCIWHLGIPCCKSIGLWYTLTRTLYENWCSQAIYQSLEPVRVNVSNNQQDLCICNQYRTSGAFCHHFVCVCESERERGLVLLQTAEFVFVTLHVYTECVFVLSFWTSSAWPRAEWVFHLVERPGDVQHWHTHVCPKGEGSASPSFGWKYIVSRWTR